MARHLRQPIPAAEFNRLALRETTRRLGTPWWNLRWAHHLPPAAVFFASKSGRLTPSGGKVPCLYLASNRETAFHEVYGDDIDVAEKARRRMAFSRSTLEHRVYLRTRADPTLKLYDLTAKLSAQKIGLDLSSLYTADVEHPREFAQRLHDHPAKFDGIQYVSRHTQARCLVLWATHNPKLKSIAVERNASLWDLCSFAPKHPPGTLELFGTVFEAAAAPPAL